MSERILIVDDENNIRLTLKTILEEEGYFCLLASSGKEAIEIMKGQEVDLVITDIWMENIDGIELIEYMKKHGIDAEIIVISGHATIELAVKATKKGAFDFLEKPLSFDKLILSVKNALDRKKLKEKNKWLLEELNKTTPLIGTSPLFQKLLEDIELAAPSDGRILIYGENGTGKEVVAKTIHFKSKRAHMPMVDVNCAAIPEELIESELFGHKKGAFTGATENKKGKFLIANGGTLFLDEIGDMSLKTQAKVLRALQENEITPVGETKSYPVDVRIIAATNKNLQDEIEKGNFRQDLYYRLNVIELYVPSLRERIEDIPLLAEFFVKKFAAEKKIEPKEITNEAMNILMSYSWPGNVRELQNLIERLMIMVPDDKILPKHIPYPINKTTPESEALLSLKDAKEEFEKEYITKVLKITHWNISQASKLLGIERSYLHKKIKKYNIEFNEKINQ
ncbi:two-component system, NtrC family, nitrogen regulation response regulator NtrX [Thermotomaculum hydrothermale]|uniref:Two-component system, NtrC family, nitrogen regulation response regulator NtrX n=1 Tax=Thermotomaculum hydrothermale TaxID=981385 RepID=A0A7R6SZE9_9BACT|nr:sigma-54 dependent transcriptional regulator [Thermotomaculum hydrothermale]BBB33670.1 two-component system, NtrC family, nitrogen regulation response regulator NtrX [Thermotomaculum hydrothermale]